jgi:hypothetical protein
MPGRDSLPSTLKRSPAKAQRTWIKTHDNAIKEYGEGARAHRTAFAALKHSFKKVGDHWEPKGQRGPSDTRAKKAGAEARRGKGESFGGVDYYGSTKQQLYEQAQKLGIAHRSQMNKKELARAIARKQ